MKILAIVGMATIAVDVEASDTIDIVKAKIQEACGTEFDSLILLCVPVPLQLEGGRTLSDYNIQPMAFLGAQIHVNVVTLTGRTMTLAAMAIETIGSVKAKIQEQERIPTHQQRLVFGGSELECGRTLSDYNIVKGATLTLLTVCVCTTRTTCVLCHVANGSDSD